MSAAAFTPGPWSFDVHCNVVALGGLVAFPGIAAGFDQKSNARLIAAAPELLAEVAAQYTELADIHNEWPGRNTPEGQQRLCRLRDLICKATGRDAQDVQDDYTSRTARTGAAA